MLCKKKKGEIFFQRRQIKVIITYFRLVLNLCKMRHLIAFLGTIFVVCLKMLILHAYKICFHHYKFNSKHCHVIYKNMQANLA